MTNMNEPTIEQKIKRLEHALKGFVDGVTLDHPSDAHAAALKLADVASMFTADLLDELARLRKVEEAANAARGGEWQCRWARQEDFDDFGTYDTGCGQEFTCAADNREENRIKYCPFCGGIIKETTHER